MISGRPPPAGPVVRAVTAYRRCSSVSPPLMIALSSEVLLPAVKMGMFPGKVLTTQILHIRRRVVGEGQGRRVVADRCTAVGIGHRVAHRHFPGEGPSRGWCTWRRTSSMPCWCSPDSGREERHEVVSEALVLEDELLARLRLTVAISVLDDREGRGLADSRTTGLRHLGIGPPCGPSSCPDRADWPPEDCCRRRPRCAGGPSPCSRGSAAR